MLQNIFSTTVHMIFLPDASEPLETGEPPSIICQETALKFAFGSQTEVSSTQSNCSDCDCSPENPYFAKRISGTNLLLVSIKNDFGNSYICPSCSPGGKRLSIVSD